MLVYLSYKEFLDELTPQFEKDRLAAIKKEKIEAK